MEIDIHCGVLFVTCKMVLYVSRPRQAPATTCGTGEWNSRFCFVGVKFNKTVLLSMGINIIVLQKWQCANRV